MPITGGGGVSRPRTGTTIKKPVVPAPKPPPRVWYFKGKAYYSQASYNNAVAADAARAAAQRAAAAAEAQKRAAANAATLAQKKRAVLYKAQMNAAAAARAKAVAAEQLKQRAARQAELLRKRSAAAKTAQQRALLDSQRRVASQQLERQQAAQVRAMKREAIERTAANARKRAYDNLQSEIRRSNLIREAHLRRDEAEVTRLQAERAREFERQNEVSQSGFGDSVGGFGEGADGGPRVRWSSGKDTPLERDRERAIQVGETTGNWQDALDILDRQSRSTGGRYIDERLQAEVNAKYVTPVILIGQQWEEKIREAQRLFDAEDMDSLLELISDPEFKALEDRFTELFGDGTSPGSFAPHAETLTRIAQRRERLWINMLAGGDPMATQTDVDALYSEVEAASRTTMRGGVLRTETEGVERDIQRREDFRDAQTGLVVSRGIDAWLSRYQDQEEVRQSEQFRRQQQRLRGLENIPREADGDSDIDVTYSDGGYTIHDRDREQFQTEVERLFDRDGTDGRSETHARLREIADAPKYARNQLVRDFMQDADRAYAHLYPEPDRGRLLGGGTTDPRWSAWRAWNSRKQNFLDRLWKQLNNDGSSYGALESLATTGLGAVVQGLLTIGSVPLALAREFRGGGRLQIGGRAELDEHLFTAGVDRGTVWDPDLGRMRERTEEEARIANEQELADYREALASDDPGVRAEAFRQYGQGSIGGRLGWLVEGAIDPTSYVSAGMFLRPGSIAIAKAGGIGAFRSGAVLKSGIDDFLQYFLPKGLGGVGRAGVRVDLAKVALARELGEDSRLVLSMSDDEFRELAERAVRGSEDLADSDVLKSLLERKGIDKQQVLRIVEQKLPEIMERYKVNAVNPFEMAARIRAAREAAEIAGEQAAEAARLGAAQAKRAKALKALEDIGGTVPPPRVLTVAEQTKHSGLLTGFDKVAQEYLRYSKKALNAAEQLDSGVLKNDPRRLRTVMTQLKNIQREMRKYEDQYEIGVNGEKVRTRTGIVQKHFDMLRAYEKRIGGSPGTASFAAMSWDIVRANYDLVNRQIRGVKAQLSRTPLSSPLSPQLKQELKKLHQAKAGIQYQRQLIDNGRSLANAVAKRHKTRIRGAVRPQRIAALATNADEVRLEFSRDAHSRLTGAARERALVEVAEDQLEAVAHVRTALAREAMPLVNDQLRALRDLVGEDLTLMDGWIVARMANVEGQFSNALSVIENRVRSLMRREGITGFRGPTREASDWLYSVLKDDHARFGGKARPLSEYASADAVVAKALRDYRQRAAEGQVRLGPKRFRPPSDVSQMLLTDHDAAEVFVKIKALKTLGMSIFEYDELRGVLGDLLVKKNVGESLLSDAIAAAAKSGKSVDDEFLRLRAERAEMEALRNFEEFAIRPENAGLTPSQMVRRFEQKYIDTNLGLNAGYELSAFQKEALEMTFFEHAGFSSAHRVRVQRWLSGQDLSLPDGIVGALPEELPKGWADSSFVDVPVYWLDDEDVAARVLDDPAGRGEIEMFRVGDEGTEGVVRVTKYDPSKQRKVSYLAGKTRPEIPKGHRVIVTGSRDYADEAFMFAQLDRLYAKHPDLVIVHGGARGADSLAEKWAASRGVRSVEVLADWDNPRLVSRNGKKTAGLVRNEEMLGLGDITGVVGFPRDPRNISPGTRHMLDVAHRRGHKIWVPDFSVVGREERADFLADLKPLVEKRAKLQDALSQAHELAGDIFEIQPTREWLDAVASELDDIYERLVRQQFSVPIPVTQLEIERVRELLDDLRFETIKVGGQKIRKPRYGVWSRMGDLKPLDDVLQKLDMGSVGDLLQSSRRHAAVSSRWRSGSSSVDPSGKWARQVDSLRNEIDLLTDEIQAVHKAGSEAQANASARAARLQKSVDNAPLSRGGAGVPQGIFLRRSADDVVIWHEAFHTLWLNKPNSPAVNQMRLLISRTGMTDHSLMKRLGMYHTAADLGAETAKAEIAAEIYALSRLGGKRWEEFYGGLDEQAQLAIDMLGSEFDRLSPALRDAFGYGPHMPPLSNRSKMRDWLELHGFWSPRTGEAIASGERVWSIAEERSFYERNFAYTPPWTDENVLRPLLNDQRALNAAFEEWGFFDNGFERLVASNDLKGARLHDAMVWGVDGVQRQRTAEELRSWAIQRYGDLVADPVDGALVRMPWLMRADSEYLIWMGWALGEPEARAAEWLAARSRLPKRLADAYFDGDNVKHFGIELDPTIVKQAEVAKLNQAIVKATDRRIKRMIENRDLHPGEWLPQEQLRFAYDVANELIADPRWRGLLRGTPVAGAALHVWGQFWRSLVAWAPAFPIMNLIDSFGPKRLFLQVLENGFRPLSLNRDGRRIVQNLRMIGAESDSIFHFDADAWARFQNKDLPINLRGGGLIRSATQLPVTISKFGEDRLRLDFARSVADRTYRAAKQQGMGEEAAEWLARAEAKRMVRAFFATPGSSGIVQALNQLVPFFSYNFNNKRIALRMVANHPAIWAWADRLQDAILVANQKAWEQEYPGVEFPDDPSARWLWFKLGENFYSVDLSAFSDWTRAMKSVSVDQSAVEWFSEFFRVPHPSQLGLWAALTGGTTPWGKPGHLREMNLFADFFMWLNGQDYQRSDWKRDLIQMGSQMLFFKAFGKITPLKAKVQQFFAFQRLDEDKARAYLEQHPDLQMFFDERRALGSPNPRYLNPDTKVHWYARMTDEERSAYNEAHDGFNELMARLDRDVLQHAAEPWSAEYKEAKRKRAILRAAYLSKHPILPDAWGMWMTPQEFAALKQDWLVDDQQDAWFNWKRPALANFESELEYQRALVQYYADREEYLRAHPALAERLMEGHTAIEQAWKEQELHWTEILEFQAKLKMRILEEQAEGDTADGDLIDLLYRVRDAAGKELDAEQYVNLPSPTPMHLRRRRFASLPGFADLLYARATPEERKVMDRDEWYFRTLKGIDAGSGREFYEKLLANPELAAEYWKRNPEKFAVYQENQTYIGWMQRWIKAMGARDFVAGQAVWDQMPQWVKDRYFAKHPDSKMRDGAGGASTAVQYKGQWFKSAESRDRYIAFVENGNTAVEYKGKWFKSAESRDRYIRWIENGGSGDSPEPFAEFSDGPPRFRSEESRQRFLRGQEYFAAIGKWVEMLQAKDYVAADAYFKKLPDWMKDKYYAKHPDQRAKHEISSEMLAHGAQYFLASGDDKLKILQANPQLRAWLAEYGGDEAAMRGLVTAMYRAIPSSEAWLKRTFRLHFPEVFGKEAAGERALAGVFRKLAEHPEMMPFYEKALALQMKLYTEQLKRSKVPPKPWTMERKSRLKKRQKRRAARMSSHWSLHNDLKRSR